MLVVMSQPLVVAHRGASHERAEHTIEAYERAIHQGADALECDVRLTADDQLVCVHDATIDRTSSGRGWVSAMTLAQLRQHDFRTWREGGEPRDAPSPRDSVLAFEDLLDLVGSAGRPVGLSVETKHPERASRRLEGAVVTALRRHGLVPRTRPVAPGSNDGSVAPAPGSVRVMSFSARALGRMRDLAPTVPTVYLTSWPSERVLAGHLPFGASILGPSLWWAQSVTSEVDRLRTAGCAVHVWTVDEADDVRRCRALGVDAIITNRPASTLRTLGRRTGR